MPENGASGDTMNELYGELCATLECRYFLGRVTGGMRVELVDGSHGAPESVAEAAKLHGRIFGNNGPWVMVEVHPMPDLDPPINEADAALCADLVRRHRNA